MPTKSQIMGCPDNFAALILTNGRPDRVYTHDSLRRCGYTGPIYIVIDDADKTAPKYRELYGDMVIVFSKEEIAKTFDQGDNFNDMRAIIYARNASFGIAEALGYKYFVQLDDDYCKFDWRFNRMLDYCGHVTRELDAIFSCLVDFLESTPALSIALSQGGDFIGGCDNQNAEAVTLTRKCMNSFVCSVDKKFKFIGRVNEDVNTYTHKASTGSLFFSSNHASLTQKQTQSNSGGMTEMYLDSGTYVKSFYSVMYQPSSVKISVLNSKNSRIHHLIDWGTTAPMILREDIRGRINGS